MGDDRIEARGSSPARSSGAGGGPEGSARPIAVTFSMLAVVGLFGWWVFTTAFVEEFTCQWIFRDRLDVPSQVCRGFDPVPEWLRGAVDRAASLARRDPPDTRVDGLAPVVDPPLGVARQVLVGAGLLLVAATSAMIVVAINSLAWFGRLLRLDPRTWTSLARATLQFGVVFAAVLAALRVLVFA